jgi:hypothetical protein
VLRAIRAELLGEAVDAFVSSVRKIDVPVAELLDLVKNKYIEARDDKADGDAAERGEGRP